MKWSLVETCRVVQTSLRSFCCTVPDWLLFNWSKRELQGDGMRSGWNASNLLGFGDFDIKKMKEIAIYVTL
jgi:hypothetical protein